MKFVLLLNISFLSFFLISSSAINSVYTPKSKIVFERTMIDLGKVPRGSKHTLSFKFTNEGEDPLVIQGVHSSCGCILVNHLASTTYQPHASGVITLKVDTSNFSSSFNKNVVLITNNKTEHHISLTVKAMIQESIKAYPPLINFDSLVSSSSFPVKHTTITYDSNIKIDNISYNKDILEVAEHPLESKGSQSLTRLDVKLKNVDFNSDSFIKESITVHNSDPNLPELQIPVRAFIQTNINFSRSYLELGGIREKETKKASFTISSLDKTGFDLEFLGSALRIDEKEPKDMDDILKVEVSKDSAIGNSYTVTLSLTNSTTLKSSVKGKLGFYINKDIKQSINFYALFY